MLTAIALLISPMAVIAGEDATSTQPPPTVEIVDPALAPGFHLRQAGGGDLALEDLRGRPVVIDFWATWCRPCRGLLTDLDRMARRAEFADVVFVAINVDTGERDRARAMIDTLQISLPVLWGGQEVMSRYWVKALPSTFLVDREGRLRSRSAGADGETVRALDQEIRKLLLESTDTSSR